jgi:VWFA-related protein
MRLLAAALAAGLAATTFAAQNQPPPQGQPPIFRAGVDVVQLEVSVLDSARRPVRGLKQKDFAVFEDGAAQPVFDVQEFVLNGGAPPPVWAQAASSDVATNSLTDRRLIAIVMDDLRCCFEATPQPNGEQTPDLAASRHARETARHLVSRLGPKDLATIALTRDPMPVLPFTNDRDALNAVIARYSPISEGQGCMPARSRTPTSFTHVTDLTRLLQMSDVPLKMVVSLMSTVSPGPKAIAKLRPCPQPSYRIPGTGQVVTRTPPRQAGPEPDPLDLASVPIYVLNVSGLTVDMTRIQKGQLPQSLNQMNGPNASGGWNFLRKNDLFPAVDTLLDEGDAYYLVGFRTSRPTTDGNYRRLEVKVTRPGNGAYEVRTRAGYRRPKPEPAPGSRAARNPEAPRPPTSVSGLLPKSGITVEATIAAFPSTVLVQVDLTHPVGEFARTQPEDLQVRAVAYRSGSSVREAKATARIDPVMGTSRVRTSVPLTLELPPDRYELWVSARDPRSLRLGDTTLPFEVPDFAARTITVTGVVLGASPADGVPLHPALSGLVPIVPTSARVFGRGSEVTAYFQLQQGGKAPPAPASLRMKILDDQGAVRFDKQETLEAARFAATRSVPYSLRLPLETLGPGWHLLSVEARLGERIAPARDVMFELR